jgi:hypothetical protein
MGLPRKEPRDEAALVGTSSRRGLRASGSVLALTIASYWNGTGDPGSALPPRPTADKVPAICVLPPPTPCAAVIDGKIPSLKAGFHHLLLVRRQKTVMQIAAIILGSASAIAAVLAAALWLLSARVKTPRTFTIHVARAEGTMGQPFGGGGLGATYVGHAFSQDLLDLATALRRQSALSARAAVCAGLAAAFQAGTVIIQICSFHA